MQPVRDCPVRGRGLMSVIFGRGWNARGEKKRNYDKIGFHCCLKKIICAAGEAVNRAFVNEPTRE